ncbi:MAG: hypothetical protein MJ059_00005 [Lachnospiraceae bacterium]|nr:hypothetical protein [Lachnospiraceae bacterium]
MSDMYSDVPFSLLYETDFESFMLEKTVIKRHMNAAVDKRPGNALTNDNTVFVPVRGNRTALAMAHNKIIPPKTTYIVLVFFCGCP